MVRSRSRPRIIRKSLRSLGSQKRIKRIKRPQRRPHKHRRNFGYSQSIKRLIQYIKDITGYSYNKILSFLGLKKRSRDYKDYSGYQQYTERLYNNDYDHSRGRRDYSLGRQLSERSDRPGGSTFRIPKGQSISSSSYTMKRDKDYYPENNSRIDVYGNVKPFSVNNNRVLGSYVNDNYIPNKRAFSRKVKKIRKSRKSRKIKSLRAPCTFESF
jgi:hypothetical protein